MRKFLISLTTILLLTNPINVSALQIKDVKNLGLDTSIFKTVYDTALPTNVILTPIFMPTQLRLTEESWIKGIYYYTVQRLGYSTLPYHYLIDSKGNVYDSFSSDERVLNIKDNSENTIVIGVLSQGNATSFSEEIKPALGELLIKVLNNNGIGINDVSVSGLRFNRNQSSNQVILEKNEIFGLWNNSLNSLLESIRPNYSPKLREYNIALDSVAVINSNIVAGEETDGTLKITNKGPNNIYITDSTYLLVEKADGSNSRFYLNNVWVSQSQFPAVNEQQTFKVNQTIDIPFKVKAPLFLGEQAEDFKIKLIGNGQLNSDVFQIKLNVDRGSKKIIQIRETETNFLRVRSEPSTAAEEIGRVDSGGRYFVLEENENGFFRIDLGDGRSGWVASWLVDVI
jgi:hypothetical protein